MILLIDNFDSFTFNLHQAICSLGVDVKVVRNNTYTVEECLRLNPKAIVIGPGPGTPDDSGLSLDLIKVFTGMTPILGICLGHQCIAQLFGGKIVRARKPVHGKMSRIHHTDTGVFKNIPQGFLATRYHSLIVDKNTMPPCLEITAFTDEGEIMALRHKTFPLEGIQFHPESVQTEYGLQLLNNFFQQRNLTC